MHKNKPWINQEMIKLIKIKNKLYQIYIKKQTDESERKYKEKKKYVNKLITDAKNTYYKHKLEIYNSNMKRKWSIINDIMGKNHKQIQK